MPFLFEPIADETELLMPDDLLSASSVPAKLHAVMTDRACRDVEIIGWLYQFYISEKKDEVFAALKKNVKITPENIPAATQLSPRTGSSATSSKTRSADYGCSIVRTRSSPRRWIIISLPWGRKNSPRIKSPEEIRRLRSGLRLRAHADLRLRPVVRNLRRRGLRRC